MSTLTRNLYCIVTAFAISVGISLPAAAQSDIGELLDRLRSADKAEAARLTREIERAWSMSGSTALDLLMRRGRKALEDDDTRTAIEHLTALTDHAPGFAEGYHLRATAYYKAGKYGPALSDLQRVLALNPNHYDALFGLGVLFNEFNDVARAEKAFRMVLDINPHHEEAKKALEALNNKGVDRSL